LAGRHGCMAWLPLSGGTGLGDASYM